MIKNLEESRNRLLFKIEKLKREIELLIWLEREELVTLYRTDSNRYLFLYSIEVESMN